MPYASDKQRRFMQLVKAYKAGKVPEDEVSEAVKKAAASMTAKEVEDFTKKPNSGTSVPHRAGLGSWVARKVLPAPRPVEQVTKQDSREARDLLARALGHDPPSVTDTTSLEDLGADELDAVELIMELEERIGAPILQGSALAKKFMEARSATPADIAQVLANVRARREVKRLGTAVSHAAASIPLTAPKRVANALARIRVQAGLRASKTFVQSLLSSFGLPTKPRDPDMSVDYDPIALKHGPGRVVLSRGGRKVAYGGLGAAPSLVSSLAKLLGTSFKQKELSNTP